MDRRSPTSSSGGGRYNGVVRSTRLRALLPVLLSGCTLAFVVGLGCVSEPSDRGGIFGDRPNPQAGTDAGDGSEDQDGASESGSDAGTDGELEAGEEDVEQPPEEDAGE
jgi:hypothetical protein